MYKSLLLHIMAEHIGDRAPSEVNLSERIRQEVQQRAMAVHEALDKVSWRALIHALVPCCYCCR